jgi:hypothetical protein
MLMGCRPKQKFTDEKIEKVPASQIFIRLT